MYVRNFLDKSEPQEIDESCDEKIAGLDSVTLTDTEKYIRSVVDTTGRNAVLISYCPQKDDFPEVSADDLRKAFISVNGMDIKPFVPFANNETILDAEPEAGKIISSKHR